MTCGQRSSCGSRSAASAPSMAGGCGQRTWTTSWTTRATGTSSPTGAIWKACATPATAAKRRGNCGKIARKRSGTERQNGASFGRRRAMRCASRGDPCRPSPRSKKFWPGRSRPQAPLRGRFFPHGKFWAAAPELCRVGVPIRPHLSFPGRRWPTTGIRQSFGASETAERRTKYGKEEKRLRRGRW